MTGHNGVERYKMYGGTGRRHVGSHRQIDISDMSPVLPHQSSHTSHGGGSRNHSRENSQPTGGNSKRTNLGNDTFFKTDPKLKKASETYKIPMDSIQGRRTSYIPSQGAKSRYGNHRAGSASKTVPLKDGGLEAKYVDMGRKQTGALRSVNSHPVQSSKSSIGGTQRKQTRDVAMYSSGISTQGKWGKDLFPKTAQETEGLPAVQSKHQPHLTSRNNSIKPRQSLHMPAGSKLDLGRHGGHLDSTHTDSNQHGFSHDKRPSSAHHSSHSSTNHSPRHSQKTSTPPGSRQAMPIKNNVDDMKIMLDGGASKSIGLKDTPRLLQRHQAAHPSNSLPIQIHQAAHPSNSLPIQIHQAAHPSNSLPVQIHQAAHPSNSLTRQPGSKQGMLDGTEGKSNDSQQHSVTNRQANLRFHQAAHPSNSLPRHSQNHTSLVGSKPDLEVLTQNNDSDKRTKNDGTRSDLIFEDSNSFSFLEIPHQASHTSNSSSRRNPVESQQITITPLDPKSGIVLNTGNNNNSLGGNGDKGTKLIDTNLQFHNMQHQAFHVSNITPRHNPA
ncbi:uncharacterized protein LOC117323907 [Pecten maximus]|uniref:uncharacterized protein LOC117323907 n=1 Tax=Pecten maximus TaxID=6579 RepID=UPI0014587AB9|nr:uncharacterized protein LOC117323907 [Pecten maximus]